MTRKTWVVVAFGLGVALAPLAHQLGTVCLRPAVAVAQDAETPSVLQPISSTPVPFQNSDEISQRTAGGQINERTFDLPPNAFDNLNSAPPQEQSSLPPAANSTEVFLELSKQKAALLTPEEMAREVDNLRKELTELRATVQLREAVGKLKQLTSEHPQSQAAQRAKRMLEVEAVPSRGTNSSPFDEADAFSTPAQPKRKLVPAGSLPTY